MITTYRLYALLGLLSESLAARRNAQIRFLKEENRILRSRLDRQRIVVSSEERYHLLAIGRELGHQVKGLVSVVQFRTYQRWLKQQQAGKAPGQVGRPRTIGRNIRQLILRLAKENPNGGFFRIVGELMKLRINVGKTSVRRILREAGHYPDPAPDRCYRPGDRPWDLFLKFHINTLVACDFFCKTIWTLFGKRQAYLMLFMHVASRKVWVSPATYQPDTRWVNQQGRNALMWLEDNGLSATHLIRDRDRKFAGSLDRLMRTAGVGIARTPVQAPNANVFAEAWVANIRRECLNYLWCFSLRHLDHIVYQYSQFYNTDRPHQSKGNRPLQFPVPPSMQASATNEPIGRIECQRQLGGLLKSYRRAA